MVRIVTPTFLRSSIVCRICCLFSPSPSMNEDLVGISGQSCLAI